MPGGTRNVTTRGQQRKLRVMDDLPLTRRRAAASRRIAVRTAIPLVCALLVLLSGAAAEARPGDPEFGPREALVSGGPWRELSGLADAYRARAGPRAPPPAA